MKKIYFLGILAIVAIAALYFSQKQIAQETYSISSGGFVSYSNRPQIEYRETPLKDSQELFIEKIIFKSKGANVYGLLSLPKTDKKLPAFLVLPGAGIRKESGLDGLGKDLNDMGFAALTLDQRGIGETISSIQSIEQDFQTFATGGEPFQHKMFYDALRAVDLLKSRKEIDPEKIYVAGESMGGRTAIIAAAIDPSIKGILAISTSGYKFGSLPDAKAEQFANSINPDNYINKISPKQLVMIHSTNDTIIPFSFAQDTFSRAGEPKKLFTTSEKSHGYTKNGTIEFLKKELENWK